MKSPFFRFLCLTLALPILLAACTAAPTGDASVAATSPDASSAEESSASVTSEASSAQASSQAVSSEPYTPPADTRVINSVLYKLTFVDEFDGTSLDSSKWACCPEGNRQDVGGKWSDSMVSVKDGCLYLGAAIDSNGTPVSGAIRTMDKWYRVKWNQCKGYFECRAKLQSAPGFWGAFWLMSNQNMGNNNNVNGAKDGAEIDIMESFSVAQGGVNHAIHWDGYGSNHKSTGKSVYNKSLYDGQFHTFGLAWTDSQYIFYIDGKETYRVGNATVADVVCEVPLYLKLTVEFGSWAGTYKASALPDAFVVDYVRVYQVAD